MNVLSCSIAVSKGGISCDKLREAVDEEVKGRLEDFETISSSDSATRMRPMEGHSQMPCKALTSPALRENR